MFKKFLYSAAAIPLVGCSVSETTHPEPSTPLEALEQAVSVAADNGKAGAILDVQGCGLSFRQAKGISNRKTKLPMPLDEQLRIASVGKLYTAAVIHKLAQQGTLDLDKSATTYLNEGEIEGVPNANSTLRQMLNHTSGVPDYYDARSYLFTDWTQPITVERTLNVARRKAATNAPGVSYSYSNTNYQILDLVAEKVSGHSLAKLIETRILEPLQLSNTRYNIEHPGGTIHGYGTKLRKNADTWKYAERTGSELWGHTGDTYGYLTFAYAIPKYDVTIIGHTNTSNEDVFIKLLQSTAKIIGEACEEG